MTAQQSPVGEISFTPLMVTTMGQKWKTSLPGRMVADGDRGTVPSRTTSAQSTLVTNECNFMDSTELWGRVFSLAAKGAGLGFGGLRRVSCRTLNRSGDKMPSPTRPMHSERATAAGSNLGGDVPIWRPRGRP